jgi:hypothetical protein
MIMASAAVAIAVLGPVVVAAPAHADVDACLDHLEWQDVEIDGYIVQACQIGQHGNIDRCRAMLREAGVQPPIPLNACRRAAD